MPVRPLHHVSMSVRSLERSIHFYRDLLGMRVSMEAVIADEEHETYLRLPKGTSGRVAVLQVGPPVGAVQLIEWSHDVPASMPLRPGNPGPFVLAFELEDETVTEILARLRPHGIEPWTEPITAEIPNFGTIKTAIVEDPDGVMVEFMELPPHRGA